MMVSESDEVMRVDFRGANWSWMPFRVASGAGRLLRHRMSDNKLHSVYTLDYAPHRRMKYPITYGCLRPTTLVNASPTTVLLP